MTTIWQIWAFRLNAKTNNKEDFLYKLCFNIFLLFLNFYDTMSGRNQSSYSTQMHSLKSEFWRVFYSLRLVNNCGFHKMATWLPVTKILHFLLRISYTIQDRKLRITFNMFKIRNSTSNTFSHITNNKCIPKKFINLLRLTKLRRKQQPKLGLLRLMACLFIELGM